MALGLTAPPTTSLFDFILYLYFHCSLSAIRDKSSSIFHKRPTITWLRFLVSRNYQLFRRYPANFSIFDTATAGCFSGHHPSYLQWGERVPQYRFAPLFALHEGYTPVLALVDTSLRQKRYTIVVEYLCLALVDAIVLFRSCHLSDLQLPTIHAHYLLTAGKPTIYTHTHATSRFLLSGCYLQQLSGLIYWRNFFLLLLTKKLLHFGGRFSS